MRTFKEKPKNQDQRLEQMGTVNPGKTRMLTSTPMDLTHHYPAGRVVGLVRNWTELIFLSEPGLLAVYLNPFLSVIFACRGREGWYNFVLRDDGQVVEEIERWGMMIKMIWTIWMDTRIQGYDLTDSVWKSNYWYYYPPDQVSYRFYHRRLSSCHSNVSTIYATYYDIPHLLLSNSFLSWTFPLPQNTKLSYWIPSHHTIIIT